jgi:DNA polymerase III delta subunit
MLLQDGSKSMLSNKIADLKPCHLYISKSNSVLDDKVESIKKFLKGKINFEVDFKIFYGAEDIGENELVNFYNTPSFFSEKKVAVIKNIEKTPPKIINLIIDMISTADAKNFITVVIITSTSLKKKLDQRLVNIVEKIGVLKELNVPVSSSLKKWLDEKTELDGIKFTGSASSKFIESVNFDLSLLKAEYEKIYTFIISEREKIVTDSMIDKLVSRIYDMKIFDLVDYIGDRDKINSIKVLKGILEEKQKLEGLITLLHRMFKSFLFIKSSDSASSSVKKYIERHIGHSPYFMSKIENKYIRYSKKYSLIEIIRIFEILNNYDILFRLNETEEKKLVLKLISEIIDLKA